MYLPLSQGGVRKKKRPYLLRRTRSDQEVETSKPNLPPLSVYPHSINPRPQTISVVRLKLPTVWHRNFGSPKDNWQDLPPSRPLIPPPHSTPSGCGNFPNLPSRPTTKPEAVDSPIPLPASLEPIRMGEYLVIRTRRTSPARSVNSSAPPTEGYLVTRTSERSLPHRTPPAPPAPAAPRPPPRDPPRPPG